MTKTTLRELSSKYKSILIKCMILNGLVLAGLVSVPAYADVYGDGGTTKLETVNPAKKDFSYTHTDGTHDKLIGAYYIAENTDVPVGTTNLTINGGQAQEWIVGGNYVNNKTGKYTIDTTNVTINNVQSGGLTGTKNNVGGYFFDGVFAGSYTKYGKGSSKPAPKENAQTNSQITTANLTIHGGQFDAPVFAGSGVDEYDGSDGALDVAGYKHTTSVGTANMKITGGTFNEGIFMGGLANMPINHAPTAEGRELSSFVTTSNLTLDGSSGNLTVNSDIYAGGAQRGEGISTVSVSNAEIKNATIQNFYGYNGAYDKTPSDKNRYNLYPFLSKADTKPVQTHLTLTDVTAEDVEIPQGTVTLNATGDTKTQLDKLLMGDNATLTLDGQGSVLFNNNLTVGKNAAIDIKNAGIRGTADITFGDNTTMQTVLNPTMATTIQANSVTFGKNNTLTVLVEDMEAKEYDFITANTITGKENVTLSQNLLYNISLLDNGKLNVESKEGAIQEIVSNSDMNATQAATTVAVVEQSTPTTHQAKQAKQMLHQALQQGDTKAAADIADKINPTQAPVQQTVATNTAVMKAVGNRLSVLSSDKPRAGLSGGETLKNMKLAPWIQGLYNKTNNSQGVGFDASTKGFAAGVDAALNNEWSIGLGYGYASSDVKNTQRKIQADSDNVFLYGQYQPNEWHASIVFNYSRTTYQDDSLLSSEYDANAYSTQVVGGYQKGLFDTIAGARYTLVKTDDYTNGLTTVKSDDTHLATLLLGTKFSKDFNCDNKGVWTPEFWVTGSYDIKSDASSAVVGVVGSTTSYTITGERLSRAAVEAGVSLTATLKEWALKASYVTELRSEHNSHTVNLKAMYNF